MQRSIAWFSLSFLALCTWGARCDDKPDKPDKLSIAYTVKIKQGLRADFEGAVKKHL